MIKRALRVGLLAGFVISLAGLYPIVGLLAPLWLAGYARPFANELIHGIWLMSSAALAVPTFVTLGFLAAWRGQAIGWREGGKAGVIGGVTAAIFVYITLLQPVNALMAYGPVTAAIDTFSANSMPDLVVLNGYVRNFTTEVVRLEWVILFAVVFWGGQGALTGWWRRRRSQPARPSLLDIVDDARAAATWFFDNESAEQTGLLVGFVVSFLALFTISAWSYAPLAQDWPQLAQLIRENYMGTLVTDPMSGGVPLLSPIFLFSLVGFGTAIVWLIKDPPTRIKARLRGVILAGIMVVSTLFSILLRSIYFNIGLAPFWAMHQMTETMDAAQLAQQQESLTQVVAAVDTPNLLITVTLALPWLALTAGLAVGLLYGGFLGLVNSLLLPLLYKRPVDRAAAIQRRLQPEPVELLPILDQLFNSTEDAYAVLAHLALRLREKKPDAARLTAALHTLGTSGETAVYLRALDVINQILAEQRSWRWSRDFAGSYAALRTILAAETLNQILEITPSPQQHTTSLPLIIVQSRQKINRILTELQKSEKVSDLAAKLIFLENGLAAIREGRAFIVDAYAPGSLRRAPLPQRNALLQALDNWQDVLLRAIQQLKGRADLVSTLANKQCRFLPEMAVGLTVRNRGLNVAQEVQMRLLPGHGYQLLGAKSQSRFEILPPEETAVAQLYLMPDAAIPRIRLEWEVLYDDAVDAERGLKFADVMEFTQPEVPFERIFPIPYVTGTPLKGNDVFVGRRDVFQFIRQNLVGAYQNNIIILHGQRRTGKTSVLYRLGEVLGETHIAVLIDMQGKPARSEADFLYAIADDIVFALEDHDIEVDLPPREAFKETPEFFFRARFLRGLLPLLGERHLLLLFDEFEELQRRVEDGRLQPDIFQFLRNLMQHEAKVDFIFAGTHKLEELGMAYWSVLFNIATYRPISFLSTKEMRRLIQEPVKESNLEYDPLAIERIIQVTAGHPYFAQLVLHEMIVYRNEMEVTYLTAVDVDEVLERIVARGEAHFRYIWAESSAEEQTVLRALAEMLAHEERIGLRELHLQLSEQGARSGDRWQSALLNLERRDILEKENGRNPRYRFKVDLIRMWIGAS